MVGQRLKFVSRPELDQKDPKVVRWLEKARQLHAANKLTNHYKAKIILAKLTEMFKLKCAYCESYAEQGDVEHFRPKSSVRGVDTHPGYKWLTYEWTNLYWSCPRCNQGGGKQDQFPLVDESARLSSEGDHTRESPLLLDPCQDSPERHLQLLPNGEVVSVNSCPRGEATIKILRLDRFRLREVRRDYLKNALELRDSQPALDLDVLIPENQMFSGLLRQFFRSHPNI
ncbi:TIGR02646 family protein [bacterium]|nr:TIGR02646 family protein [bacterium]